MKTKTLLLTALFAALTAVGAFLKIPLPVAPITLQFLFTVLAGILLGPKYGALSQLVYVALGLFGLPIFTQGGGISYVLIPTFGFLLALIPCAWIVGILSGGCVKGARIWLACLAGTAVLYLIGLPYLYLILNVYLGKGMGIWAVIKSGMLIFLPGDALKITAAVLLSKKLLPALKNLSIIPCKS
jgi:biotin transport system substrate-specific component